MPIPPETLSWLDYSNKSLVQAVLDWDKHRNARALEVWLSSNVRVVGDINALTPELMRGFVAGINLCSPTIVASYDLPLQWPPESIGQTQEVRRIMLDVPSWRASCEPSNDDQGDALGFRQLLYPTQRTQAILDAALYDPGTESSRLHLGMKPNKAWWDKFPFWSAEQYQKYETHSGWTHLVRQLVLHPHPQQGLHIALIADIAKNQQKTMESPENHSQEKASAFAVPSAVQVMASSIQDKMPLVLWRARYCDRTAPPEPSWWEHWDKWCQECPIEAELSLVCLLLADLHGQDPTSHDGSLRGSFARLASLRNPPEHYSISNIIAERKKYEHCTLDELVRMAFPVENATMRFLEGLAPLKEQLVLHYQMLHEKTRSQPGLENITLPEFLFGDGARV